MPREDTRKRPIKAGGASPGGPGIRSSGLGRWRSLACEMLCLLEMSSSSQPKIRRATYADVEALPAHLVGEIIAGELVASPRPSPPHTETASALGYLISGPFRFGNGGPGGWWIEDEPELRLGIDPDFDPVVPDLAGWRKERFLAVAHTGNEISLLPDWVCEIVSTNWQTDVVLKRELLENHQVPYYWIVNPLEKVITLLTFDHGAKKYHPSYYSILDDEVMIKPFGITISLSEVFSDV